jgi:hypothetical protein
VSGRRDGVIGALLVAVALVGTPIAAAMQMAPGPGPAREVHGADSVFADQGVVIVWAVLRGATEDETEVVIRVAAKEGYGYLAVDAVDPFSQARRAVLPGAPLTGSGEPARRDVRSLRRLFADFPRRDLRFYRTQDDWEAQRPALTVYYLGLPDTAPEFALEGALTDYLTAAVARAWSGTGRR